MGRGPFGMQKQHSSPQRHSDLWHITIKQYHCSTMGCKGSLVLMVTEAFLSVGISRQTKNTTISVISVSLW